MGYDYVSGSGVAVRREERRCNGSGKARKGSEQLTSGSWLRAKNDTESPTVAIWQPPEVSPGQESQWECSEKPMKMEERRVVPDGMASRAVVGSGGVVPKMGECFPATALKRRSTLSALTTCPLFGTARHSVGEWLRILGY